MRQLSDIILHQRPLTLPGNASVKDACKSMTDRRVGAVLITTGSGTLTGIFTGRDAIARVLAVGRDAGQTTLAEVMTADPQCMAPGSTAIEALRLMQNCGCRHIPVVEKGKVIGIVSRGDMRGGELDRLDEETGLWERIA
jgi:CBS domain-containing protein